jgi:hypothetical protein
MKMLLLLKMGGGGIFWIIVWSGGLNYCRILVPAGYAFSPQLLPDIERPDMPFPGN